MRERLRTGEWDAWLCSLRACLPRAPPGLLERRLLQFLEWGSEAARDLRQPEFLRVLAVALSSFSPEVWESLLHDSTSPKLLMQRIREEVLARGLGPVGRVDIPREVWDSCVPDGFAELVGNPPLSDGRGTQSGALLCEQKWRLPACMADGPS